MKVKMDREKVIKGLECHRIDNNHRINCADCPYYVDDDNHIRCVNDLHDDALSLLKQEAVKPVMQIEQNEYIVCGNCHNHLISRWMFCPYCGKPISWEGR